MLGVRVGFGAVCQTDQLLGTCLRTHSLPNISSSCTDSEAVVYIFPPLEGNGKPCWQPSGFLQDLLFCPQLSLGWTTQHNSLYTIQHDDIMSKFVPVWSLTVGHVPPSTSSSYIEKSSGHDSIKLSSVGVHVVTCSVYLTINIDAMKHDEPANWGLQTPF